MTHHHDHDHGHSHSHSHDDKSEMPFEEKLSKILDHWIKHNKDHADTYKDWADRARNAHMEAVAELLESAADLNFTMNEKFEAAKKQISSVK